MDKLYGPVFRHDARIWHREIYSGSVLDGDIYRKGGIYVRAVFNRSRVILLELSVLDRVLGQQDVDAFLRLNGEGSRWELGKDSTETAKYYRRLDDGAIAQWALGDNGSLLVSAENLSHLEDRVLQ